MAAVIKIGCQERFIDHWQEGGFRAGSQLRQGVQKSGGKMAALLVKRQGLVVVAWVVLVRRVKIMQPKKFGQGRVRFFLLMHPVMLRQRGHFGHFAKKHAAGESVEAEQYEENAGHGSNVSGGKGKVFFDVGGINVGGGGKGCF